MTQSAKRGPGVVLVVEDEPLVRMMVSEQFADEGFEVLQAADADEALAIFRDRDDVGLLFTDVEMPGSIDGFGLANWVRGNRPGVKTMIASGRAMPRAGDVPRGAAFLGKPYDLVDLVERCRRMMAS